MKTKHLLSNGMDKKTSIRTHRFKFTFVFLALMMGLGTAWGQTPGPNDCVKVTKVVSGTTTIEYYQRLTGTNVGAFNVVGSGAAGNYTIELLWSDSDPRLTDQYTLDNMTAFGTANKNITITTTQDSDLNPAGSNHFIATIKRGSTVATNAAMLGNSNGTLTLENIILDGMNISSTGAGAVLRVTGGTVNLNAGTVLQNGITTGNGGLVSVTNNNTVLNINGATFKNGQAALGGGVHYNVLASNYITEATFINCSATSDGGGLYLSIGTNGTTETVTNVTFTNCSAGGNGGGIYKKNQNFVLTNATFTNCSAANGGAVYHNVNTSNEAQNTFTLNSPISITECSASNQGSAIYQQRGRMFFEGGSEGITITENTGTGAIEVGDYRARLYFSGKVQIKDNESATGEKKNVVLAFDYDNIINTKAPGLASTAEIGVYCDGVAYGNHGYYGQNFGTADNTANLDKFVNDIHSTLTGEANGSLISWPAASGDIYVCKITDDNDNLLYKDAAGTQPAVYTTLADGISAAVAATLPLYNAGVAYTGDIKLKLLEETAPMTAAMTHNRARKITITTAGTDDSDGYPYTGSGTKATIKRAWSANASMFTVNDSGAILDFENITIDGSGTSISEANSRILTVSAGESNILTSATLQNAKATNGGIAHVSGTGKLVLKGGTLQKGLATNEGGGVYLTGTSAYFTMTSGTITKCEAQRDSFYAGGGVCAYNSNNFVMDGGTISDCHAPYAGGGAIGIDHDDWATINGGLITDCTAGNHGGAIEIHGGLIMTGGTITHCHSAKGGAVNFYSNTEGVVYLSGSPKIYDNTVEVNGETKECNIDIYHLYSGDSHKNTAIRVLQGTSLNSEAIIGVYSDKENSIDGTFGSYTSTAQTIGNGITCPNPSGVANYNWAAFRNDNKGGLLVGDAKNASSQGNLIWRAADPIVRVQRDGNPTWQYFEHLTTTSGGMGAFDYTEMMSDEVSAVIIETLKDTHTEFTFSDGYTFTKDFAYTLRTIEGSWEGLSGAVLAPTNYTTITRGYDGKSLFTLSHSASSLTIERLTLDGAYNFSTNSGRTCNTNGGLVNVPTLTVRDGATLKNSKVGDSNLGGAAYLSSSNTFTVEGLVVIENNKHGDVLDNVYLDSDPAKYVTIDTEGLECGSHIGITKTPVWSPDVNGVKRNLVAIGADTGNIPATNCLNAFHNGYIFDDKGTYTMYYVGNCATGYEAGQLYYFETTWGNVAATAVAGTDYTLDGEFVATVLTNKGLAYLAKDVNSGKNYSGKTVNLSNDINLSGYYWVPIGLKGGTDDCSNTFTGKPFAGTFKGNGHIIRNMMSILPYQAMGLFGFVDGGTITNTFIESGILTGTFEQTGQVAYLGGLVGEMNNGTVTYCESATTLKESAASVTGGLAGKVTGTSSIHSSMAMPTMIGGHDMGGLVGQLASGSLKNSFANAMFFASGTPTVGGLVGSNTSGTVENCYARRQDGSTTGSNFGWLVGSDDSGTTQYCYIPAGETVYIGNVVTDPTNCGTYTATNLVNDKYGYNQNDQLVETTPLVDKLNARATGDYAKWTRTMASPINGDYPVLMMPGNNCLGSKDGLFIYYDDNVNELWTDPDHGFSSATSGTMFLYDVQPTIDPATTPDPVSITGNTNVPLYIHENVGITQADGKKLNARVGVTLDNSKGDASLWEKPYDWHMFSSALTDAPLGITYNNIETHSYGFEIPSTYIELQPTGYFPTTTPFVSFDFYCFYEPQYHWINFKRHSNDHWHQDEPHAQIVYTNESDLNPGKGYMIAIDATTMLMADGELNNGDTPAKNLSNTSGAAFPGINLIGNPYQSYLDFDEFASVNSGSLDGGATSTYAMVDADQTGYVFYTAGSTPSLAPRYVHPHQGFFVGVKSGVTSLSFTNAMRVAGKGNSTFREEHLNYPLVNLFCFDANGKRDYTTVEINRPDAGGGRKFNAPKISNAWISAHFDNCDYQTLFAPEGVSEVPVRFEALEDGIYTMKWSMFNGDFNYVHLIDNRTGADIDLLAADEYKFEGKTSDYVSRFKLVFEVTDIEEPETDETTTGATTFAFQNGDELVVTGNGILQFFDLNGRCLMSTQLAGEQSSVSLPNVASGMYLLRLTGSKQTQVQKIIIK